MLGMSVTGELPETGDKIQPIAVVAGAAAAAGGWRGTQGEYSELMRRLIIGRTDGVREALAQAENAFKVRFMWFSSVVGDWDGLDWGHKFACERETVCCIRVCVSSARKSIHPGTITRRHSTRTRTG